jgi:hypothetical protein
MGSGTCEAHPDRSRVGRCVLCRKELCAECAVYEIGRGVACGPCGDAEIARAPRSGMTALGLVALGYLAVVAIGVLAFKGKALAVGVAALFAVFLSRLLPLRPSLGRVDIRRRSQAAPEKRANT